MDYRFHWHGMSGGGNQASRELRQGHYMQNIQTRKCSETGRATTSMPNTNVNVDSPVILDQCLAMRSCTVRLIADHILCKALVTIAKVQPQRIQQFLGVSRSPLT